MSCDALIRFWNISPKSNSYSEVHQLKLFSFGLLKIIIQTNILKFHHLFIHSSFRYSMPGLGLARKMTNAHNSQNKWLNKIHHGAHICSMLSILRASREKKQNIMRIRSLYNISYNKHKYNKYLYTYNKPFITIILMFNWNGIIVEIYLSDSWK